MKTNSPRNKHPLAICRVPLEVRIRYCLPEDLPQLEWFGMFSEHREVIEGAYARQVKGENLMLVAELNQFPVGQIWIDLVRRQQDRTGFLWAARVFPVLRNSGIGSELMRVAEKILEEGGYEWAELGVEKRNAPAKRLYERLGYQISGSLKEEFSYTTPEGVLHRVPLDEWIMRKKLQVDIGASEGRRNFESATPRLERSV